MQAIHEQVQVPPCPKCGGAPLLTVRRGGGVVAARLCCPFCGYSAPTARAGWADGAKSQAKGNWAQLCATCRLPSDYCLDAFLASIGAG
ncbi:MAG: hypothetical protein ACI4XO_01355 [Akkermansia sp.]